jgi:tetratricopeptide (TPR) repeat protein
VQRAESLVGLFYLLTLYCFLRGADSSRAAWWFAASVVACLLGMASKEVMVSAPLMLLLYDRTFLAGSFREAWRRRWGWYLALAGTWLLLGWLVISTGNLGSTAESATGISSWAYLCTQFGAIAHYLRLCLWPHPLVLDYGTDTAQNAREIVPYAIVVGLLGLATLAALWRWPKAGFLGAWFFAILAPTSSVLPLVGQTINEHRMYLPLAAVVTGLVVAGFLAGRSLVQGGKISSFACRLLAGCLVICASAGLGILTFQRNRDYQSDLAIWQDTVAKAPHNARSHSSLGVALARRGQVDEAITHFQKALEIKPDYAEAHNNLALALAGRGQVDEAIAHYHTALEVKPDETEAHNNLALVLAGRGQVDEAVAHYHKALEVKPDCAEVHNNLAMALAGRGQVDEAITHFQKALEIKPDYAEAQNNLGNSLAGCGEVDAAIAHYRKALEIEPDYAKAHNNLGVALARCGHVDEAITHFQKALEIKPDCVEARRNLELVRCKQR